MGKPRLLSGADLKAAIKKVLAAKGRRVVLTAFVGNRPVTHLGRRPEGIELYCWPKEHATSGRGIRELRKAGVMVRFVEGLHAKVYWSRVGAVVGSANLSDSGIEAKVGREVGVFLKYVEFGALFLKIHADSYEPTEDKLKELDVEYGQGFWKGGRRTKVKLPSFIEWLKNPKTPVLLGITVGDFSATRDQKSTTRSRPELDKDGNWALDRKEWNLLRASPRKQWTLDAIFESRKERCGSMDLSYCGDTSDPIRYPRDHRLAGRNAIFALKERYWPSERVRPFALTPDDKRRLRRWFNELRDRKDPLAAWEAKAYESYLYLNAATAKRLRTALLAVAA